MVVEDPVVRNNEAIVYLSISRATLDRLVAAGKLKRFKIGTRASGFRLSELRRYIDAQECAE